MFTEFVHKNKLWMFITNPIPEVTNVSNFKKSTKEIIEINKFNKEKALNLSFCAPGSHTGLTICRN